MSTDPANLEFTADEMRRMGYATIELFVEHILSLETQPARGDVAAADLCRRLREPAPERGVAYEPRCSASRSFALARSARTRRRIPFDERPLSEHAVVPRPQ